MLKLSLQEVSLRREIFKPKNFNIIASAVLSYKTVKKTHTFGTVATTFQVFYCISATKVVLRKENVAYYWFTMWTKTF